MNDPAEYVVLDAARDYLRVAYARLVSPEFGSLFDGARGERLEHVAPHLFRCDPKGVVAHFAVGGAPPGEVGLLADTPAAFFDLRRHFRRFLTVVREEDRKRAYFRFYDPRVLRAFLPVCTPDELRRFFGPVAAFHCQGDEAGDVCTYTLDGGRLVTRTATVIDFFQRRYGLPREGLERLLAAVNLPALPSV